MKKTTVNIACDIRTFFTVKMNMPQVTAVHCLAILDEDWN